jgi:hypothetical protein
MFFCDIYYISLGMLAFSTSFFSSVMRINTQHINVHPNVRRLLMERYALAPHQIVTSETKITQYIQILKYLPSTIIAVFSAITLVYITLTSLFTYIQSIDK